MFELSSGYNLNSMFFYRKETNMRNSFNLEVEFRDVPRMPYEWEKTTMIMHIDVKRVSTSFLKRVLLNEGKIDYKANILLISDGKNSLVLKLDRDGVIKKRSHLAFTDSLDICEYAYNLRETNIDFVESGAKVLYKKGKSVEEEMKEYIIDSLKKGMPEDLSKYLYYLYFDEIEDYSVDKLIKSIRGSSIEKNMKLYKFLIES